MAKIMLCVHQFFPRFFSGTEALTLAVAEELKKRGHAVVIFTAEPQLPGDEKPESIKQGFREIERHHQPTLREDTWEGLPVWRLFVPEPTDPLERLDRESNEYPLVGLYEELISHEQPNIVHVFHLMRITMTFVETVHRHKIPVYFTTTDFWVLCPKFQMIRYDDLLCTAPDSIHCFLCSNKTYIQKLNRPGLKFRLAMRFPRLAAFANKGARTCQKILDERIKRHQRLMGLFDGVFWSSAFMRDLFHQNGLRCRDERILSFPVPDRAKALFELSAPDVGNQLRVAFIGTFIETKGPQVLLRAIKKIEKTVSLHVSLWGRKVFPEFFAELKHISRGDPRIHFRGTFPQERFVDVLKETDVVVIPSLWYENTPLTALSALAAKRVLVASNLGGMANLIDHGKNGYLFPPGDADALGEILTLLAQNKRLISRTVAQISPPSRVFQYVDEIESVYFPQK
jgi:glycosyltransferase involved in cell wall biosynthesis